jgi:hypothetical protein
MAASDNTTMKVQRRTILLTAIGLLAATATAQAAPESVELTLVDRETGQPLKIWRHRGRLFVAGELGARYSLRVTNHTQNRVLVVLSIDGVNVLSGDTANYDQRGYVFNPGQSYDVPGWRKSDTEVADFTFAPLPQSYAAQTGRPNDVGVIGMAVFNEKVVEQTYAAPLTLPLPPVPNPAPRSTGLHTTVRSPAAMPPPDIRTPVLPLPAVRNPQPEAIGPPLPAPPAPPAPPASRLAAIPNRLAERAAPGQLDEKLGTAHGARESSVVHSVTFVRATSYPQKVQQIEYDTFDHLVASGVIPRNVSYRPRPFPAEPEVPRYVPDPPGAR